MRRLSAVLLAVAGILWACAPLSKEVMRQVDENLTYQTVYKNPQDLVGKMVLWGGVIVKTTNRQDETILEVRQAELDIEKRPKNPDSSAGRFIVRHAGFLDPVIYKEGREITVAGEITGKETLPLGGIQYGYPVIRAKEIHLWEKIDPRYDRYPYWDYPPYWGPYWSPYAYPYWRRWPYRW
ncbi:MAG: Slp family lipoprotein [Syntrophaceae bacterium]|nr:Slp family lipoprotein [Syntrophaceae bacterium]